MYDLCSLVAAPTKTTRSIKPTPVQLGRGLSACFQNHNVVVRPSTASCRVPIYEPAGSCMRPLPFYLLLAARSSEDLLNRSVSISRVTPRRYEEQSRLVTFDSTAQAWGEYIGGFEWDLFCCLTFRSRPSRCVGFRMAVTLFRECGKAIQSKVSYIAVPEWRTSGCGMPAIPLHWHLLAACPPQRTDALVDNIRRFWSPHGSSDIRQYDPSQSGAFYLAKTASNVDFDLILGNLDRMTYRGKADLLEQMANNNYVPEHAHYKTPLKTLAVRSRSSSTGTS
jgi:hypothetical protein